MSDEMLENITATKVPVEEMIEFLPRHFKCEMIEFETYVYFFMDSFCSEYNGGNWNFFELSNGGAYMAPNVSADKEINVAVPTNGYSGRMSEDAAGIVMTLFAMSLLMEKMHSKGKDTDAICDKYYWLRDFAAAHPEMSKIYSAID
jgi:hypothetical protein